MAKSADRKVLFAWELGANLGHVKPMVAIARELIKGGVKAVFAVRDLEHAHALNDDGAFVLIQAPIWPQAQALGVTTGPSPATPTSWQASGSRTRSKLGAVVGAWDALLDLVEPDVVVVDHSPALVCRTLRAGHSDRRRRHAFHHAAVVARSATATAC